MKVVDTVIYGQATQILVPESDPRPAVKKIGAPEPSARPATTKKRSPAKAPADVRTK
jgi:hypothetical protein